MPIMETVYRLSGRICASDGTGYSDRVDDETIKRHISEASDDDRKFIAFAEAVLAIRTYERVAAR